MSRTVTEKWLAFCYRGDLYNYEIQYMLYQQT